MPVPPKQSGLFHFEGSAHWVDHAADGMGLTREADDAFVRNQVKASPEVRAVVNAVSAAQLTHDASAVPEILRGGERAVLCARLNLAACEAMLGEARRASGETLRHPSDAPPPAPAAPVTTLPVTAPVGVKPQAGEAPGQNPVPNPADPNAKSAGAAPAKPEPKPGEPKK